MRLHLSHGQREGDSNSSDKKPDLHMGIGVWIRGFIAVIVAAIKSTLKNEREED